MRVSEHCASITLYDVLDLDIGLWTSVGPTMLHRPRIVGYKNGNIYCDGKSIDCTECIEGRTECEMFIHTLSISSVSKS